MFGLIPFFRSTIGKKVLMAVSGLFLFAFCVEHVTGALLFLKGPDAINGYGRLLHYSAALIWFFRAGLIVSAVVHVTFATLLYFQELAARPVGYRDRRYLRASYAARTMVYSGPFLLAFVIFHLAHLTWGYNVVPGPFIPGDIYANMLNGFRTGWVALVYLGAVSLLGLHLLHGAHSMFESLGLRHRRIESLLFGFARVAAVAIAVGLALAPAAVFFRMIGG
jgi:succinate dehydrogenase (or fumarate reductase) cytochrome b subunit, b558 family